MVSKAHRINFYRNHQLGLQRDGTVVLKSCYDLWKTCYEQESKLIKESIGSRSLKFHHIGSTSVPNLLAKPIIDILGIVSDLKDLDTNKEALLNLGYKYKGEYGIQGRRYCTLYDEKEEFGFFHLHFFQNKNPIIEAHLRFRDLLKTHQNFKQQYEDLKKDLVFTQKLNRSHYTAAKSELIQKILES